MLFKRKKIYQKPKKAKRVLSKNFFQKKHEIGFFSFSFCVIQSLKNSSSEFCYFIFSFVSIHFKFNSNWIKIKNIHSNRQRYLVIAQISYWSFSEFGHHINQIIKFIYQLQNLNNTFFNFKFKFSKNRNNTKIN